MNTKSKAVIAMLALGASAWVIVAQDNGAQPDRQRPRRPNMENQDGPGADGGPGARGRRPVPPIINALDANHDRVIDAEEIAAAPAALKKLDKNGDGKLTMDELMPPPPGMGGPGDEEQGQGDGAGRPRRNNRPPGPPPGDQ